MNTTQVRFTRDAALIYPPFVGTSVNGPHLAMGVLPAYLRSKGMSVSTWDVNIRFVRWLLSPAKLERETSALRKSFEKLGSRDQLEWNEYLTYRKLSQMVHIDADLADATRATDDSAFGALSRVITSLYGSQLTTILRSIDAIVDGLKSQQADPPILSEFLAGEQNLFSLLQTAAVVGINVSFSEQLHAACMIAKELSDRFGEQRPLVVLGGTQISLLEKKQIRRLLELPYLDGCVIYEGERPIEAIIERVRAEVAKGMLPVQADLSSVPNLFTKKHPFALTLAQPLSPEDFPAPTFEDHNMRLYFPPLVLPVYVTKGCYWGKCTFCDYTKLNTPTNRRWVERSVKRVVEDIKYLLGEHAVTTFQLISDAVPPVWYREFADEIIAEKIHLRFFSYMKNEHPAVLTQNFFNRLSRAGVKLLICGVESPIDRILDVIDKGTTQKDIEANFRMMAAAGIRAVCNLIPDYPSTRFEEVKEVIRFVSDNADYIPVLNCQFFDLSIASAIAGHPEMYEVKIDDSKPMGSSHGCHTLAFQHTSLTAEQQVWMRRVFPALSEMLARYHHTKDALRTLSQPEFEWPGTFFLFQPFRRVHSRFANPRTSAEPEVVHAGRDVIWLREPRLGGEIELPLNLTPVVELMESDSLVSFDSLLKSGGFEVSAMRDFMKTLAKLGFIRQIFGGEGGGRSRQVQEIFAQVGSPPV